MPDAVALLLSLVVLAATLASAIAAGAVPEGAVAAVGAAALVACGAIGAGDALDALEDLAPTVGFLAALLVLAEGCRRDGLFDAAGAAVAWRAHGSPRRLLALVFAVACAVTVVLSLDATVVLLTPVVLATAARLRAAREPHAYACAHLANSASLWLPVSNLTNLLAFHASGLSFLRFAALMVLPTAAVVAVEWAVLSRFFAGRLRRARAVEAAPARPLPRRSLAVLACTLAGFVASSALGIAPVWVAAAGALAVSFPFERPGLGRLARAVEPGFLVFVLGLGVIVATANARGLGDAVDGLVPAGEGLLDLLAVTGIAAVLANLVNNLPATLVLVPAAAAAGPAAVLAVLVGVNVGPNLTYAGSLATLLWRRVLHRDDTAVDAREFLTLGALTVPAGLVAGTACVWLAVQLLGTS